MFRLSEIDNQIDAVIARSAEQNLFEPKACEVFSDRQSKEIVIYFDNGCKFEYPILLLQGVCNLTDDEIADVKLTPAGWDVTWENADFDFGVNELVQGIFGTKAWMKEIAARRSCSRSQKKQVASRTNGKKVVDQEKLARLLALNLGYKSLDRSDRIYI